jgi:hypothetical protein
VPISRGGGGYGPPASALRVVTSSFSATENPLSEGGVWGQAGSSWTVVQSSGGIAYGTQTSNAEPYDDSYALLAGTWRADQEVEMTLSVGTPSGNQEVECWLRGTTNGTNSTTGYECNYQQAGAYMEVVKWNGALGSFTVLVHLAAGLSAAVSGDKLRARISGDEIRVYYNDVLKITKDINTDIDGNAIGKYTSGAPGIGFFRNDAGTNGNDQYGATAVTAREL